MSTIASQESSIIDTVAEPGLIEADQLGQRIRQARHSIRMTMKELGSVADLSTTYVSHLEHGRSVPTIGALSRIAHATGRPMSYFFGQEAPGTQRVTVVRRKGTVRRSGIPPASSGSGRERKDACGHWLHVKREILACSHRVAVDRNGQVGVLILSGRVEVEIGRSAEVLQPVESAFATSAQLMCVRNLGPGIAEVLWVYFDGPNEQ